MEESFLGATWLKQKQRRHVHFSRAVLRNAAKKYHEEIADKIRIALENQTKMQQLYLDLEKHKAILNTGHH